MLLFKNNSIIDDKLMYKNNGFISLCNKLSKPIIYNWLDILNEALNQNNQ